MHEVRILEKFHRKETGDPDYVFFSPAERVNYRSILPFTSDFFQEAIKKWETMRKNEWDIDFKSDTLGPINDWQRDMNVKEKSTDGNIIKIAEQ